MANPSEMTYAELRQILEPWRVGPKESKTRRMAETVLSLLQRQEWIPVSERLPDPASMDDVLVFKESATRFAFITSGRSVAGDPYITHWQPLPPAPQSATTKG